MASPAQLLPHQQDVVRALDAWFDGPRAAGLVVLPTGAGKSRCASTWLARRVVPRGVRVMWLAHRTALLDQAAAELRRAMPERAVRVVSSAAEPMASLQPTDGLVVASVGTAARRSRRLARWFRAGPALVVLDEAHHAPAPTFRRVLELAERHRARRIGLTATPTRSTPAERPVLSGLFDGHVVARVEVPPLVERGVLARAILVRVPTGAVADDAMTERQARALGRHVELPAAWLRRLATLAPRNETIVRHLVENRARYRPALVVACDVLHAALLTRRLAAAGLRARYVASYRPDGSVEAARETLDMFRRGELDVLVSVDLLVEGVDLPNARSLLLVRPVRSEIAIRQLVGRVLRGPLVGGTADAYVVAFEDTWTRLTHCHVTPAVVASSGIAPCVPPVSQTRSTVDTVPFDALAAADARVSGQGVAIGRADEHRQTARLVVRTTDGESYLIPVLSTQELGWRRLVETAAGLHGRALGAADPAELIATAFPWFEDVPPAAVADVARLLEHLRVGHPPPSVEPIDAPWHPARVAARIVADDLGERARVALLAQQHAAARVLFPSLDDYRTAVEAALRSNAGRLLS